MFIQPSNCLKCDYYNAEMRRCYLGFFNEAKEDFDPGVSLHENCRLIIHDINKAKQERFEEDMAKNRKVLIPQVYKHFKNKLYCTMAISEPIGANVDVCLKDFYIIYIKHTEKDEPIGILKNKKTGKYYHLEEDDKDKLVLYRSLYDSTGIYGRPRTMFLSPVDKEKYPDVKQYWRLEVYDYKEEM